MAGYSYQPGPPQSTDKVTTIMLVNCLIWSVNRYTALWHDILTENNAKQQEPFSFTQVESCVRSGGIMCAVGLICGSQPGVMEPVEILR